MCINSLTTQTQVLTTLRQRAFKNIMGKEENAVFFFFLATINLSSAYAFNLVQAKILLFGKGLINLNQALTLEEMCKFYKNFQYINPLPDDKILDWSKLKAFADDKLNVTKMIISVFDRVENIVGKGEIACKSNLSFSHNVFKRLLSQRLQ